jgi:NIPSNAP
MRNLWCILAVLGLAGVWVLPAAAEEKEKVVEKAATRVFELRTYYAASGKMDALNARFRDHTNGLFKKHGMEIVGFWQPTDPKKADQLIYMLAFPSREAADKSWKAFQKDADWIKAKEASEKHGKLVDKVESVFLSPTDYSPIK